MSYKLTYFDFPGRGESIRLLFALAKVPYEDHRISKEEFARLKPTFKYGQVPVLYVDGKELSQSSAILRYLARKFKLAGEDEWESARCDEIVDATNDLVTEWVKFNFSPDPAKKEELKTTLLNTYIPKYLGKFESVQRENGGSFLVGKNVTWADIHVSSVLRAGIAESLGKGILDDYPKLKKMTEAVFALPEIKAYIDSRAK